MTQPLGFPSIFLKRVAQRISRPRSERPGYAGTWRPNSALSIKNQFIIIGSSLNAEQLVDASTKSLTNQPPVILSIPALTIT
jgi:hypothetical protein